MIVIIVLWLLPFVLSPFSSKAALFSRMLQAALSATKCIKTLVTLGLVGTLSQILLLFSMQKLDAFTSVAFRRNLQHSSAWHSVNKKGYV